MPTLQWAYPTPRLQQGSQPSSGFPCDLTPSLEPHMVQHPLPVKVSVWLWAFPRVSTEQMPSPSLCEVIELS